MSTARDAIRAEWTKLRTTPGPAWLLLATAAVTVTLSVAVCATATCPGTGCDIDVARLALSGVYLFSGCSTSRRSSPRWWPTRGCTACSNRLRR